MKTEVLGIRFDNVTMEQAAELGGEMLKENRFHYVVTPNPEFILASEKDESFKDVLNGADLAGTVESAMKACTKRADELATRN